MLRTTGEHARELVQSATPPFDDRGYTWRPAWTLPELPAGWDVV